MILCIVCYRSDCLLLSYRQRNGKLYDMQIVQPPQNRTPHVHCVLYRVLIAYRVAVPCFGTLFSAPTFHLSDNFAPQKRASSPRQSAVTLKKGIRSFLLRNIYSIITPRESKINKLLFAYSRRVIDCAVTLYVRMCVCVCIYVYATPLRFLISDIRTHGATSDER